MLRSRAEIGPSNTTQSHDALCDSNGGVRHSGLAVQQNSRRNDWEAGGNLGGANGLLQGAPTPPANAQLTSTWDNSNPAPGVPTTLSNLEQTFTTEMSAEALGLGDEFYTDSLNWIPLAQYPSPYGPDLAATFEYTPPQIGHALTSQAEVYPAASTLLDAPYHHSPSQVHQPSHEGSDTNFPVTYSSPSLPSPTAPHGNSLAFTDFHIDHAGSTGILPKRKRRKVQPMSEATSQERGTSTEYAFPRTDGLGNRTNLREKPPFMTPHDYSLVKFQFQQLCLDPNPTPANFGSETFPSLDTFDHCINLYFDHFHDRFPLVHRPTFLPGSHWLVLLAVATIGSSFADIPDAPDFRAAFQEVLRRAASRVLERYRTSEDLMVTLTAKLLNLIGLAQSEDEQLRSFVPRYHADVSRSCLETGLLQSVGLSEPNENASSSSFNIFDNWHTWIRQESKSRLGYLIWLTDCSLAYLANSRPLCNLDDARAPLPCSEELWEAESAESWGKLIDRKSIQPSLCSAVEKLYMEKRTDPSLGELHHILLIHALYQKTWEIGTHLKQPLSGWVPTAKTRGFLVTPSKDTFWLPSYPLYENWRNSACDCLDTLQWHASSIVAKASGLEHSSVLHLHLARIILLTPFQEIQDLLFSLIGRYGRSSTAALYVHDGSYQTQNPGKLPQIHKITWRWLREDQHKARLAMVHAGSVFWHIRRYSSNSFYEPAAIYLASIVLFAYGSYKSAALAQVVDGSDNSNNTQTSTATPLHGIDTSSSDAVPSTAGDNQVPNGFGLHIAESSETLPEPGRDEIGSVQVPGGEGDDGSDDGSSAASSDSNSSTEHPTFIHLDRPCDDEIVHHFVRRGHNMRGFMSHVGDICTAPAKVLKEGAKLLKTMGPSHWGVSREYYNILITLAELRKVGS